MFQTPLSSIFWWHSVKPHLCGSILSFGRKQGWILHFAVPSVIFIDVEVELPMPPKKMKI